MIDITASCDTAHPDENGEQTLRAAMLAFPRTVRFITVQSVKKVNEGTLFVRVNALDQKLAATLQSEVLQVEESGDEEETETMSSHNDTSALFGPIERLRRAAEQGDVDAQYNLGNKYHIGLGVDEDKAEAVKWYRKAANQDNMYGQEVLGNCYRDGIGVDKDMTEAVKWYRKAAEQGEAEAQYQLGISLLNGKGTAKDPKEAADWFEKAAEQDNLDACYEIGRAYERGNGRTKNMNKATEWYKKGAATGNYGCCVQLGFRYLRGDCSTIKKDVDKALELFLQSIKGNQNGIWAYHGAGLAYLERAQGLSDSPKAVEMFRKAADRGLSESQHCLGKCYETGRGIVKNPKEAEEWYRKAAEQGHKNAKQALKRLGVDSE